MAVKFWGPDNQGPDKQPPLSKSVKIGLFVMLIVIGGWVLFAFVLNYELPQAWASTTSLTLVSSASCTAPGSTISLTGTLLNVTGGGTPLVGYTVLFKVSKNGGGYTSAGSGVTDASGEATVNYILGADVAEYSFYADFLGGGGADPVTSSTINVHSQFIAGWGTLASGLTATLTTCAANWGLVTPSIFIPKPSTNPPDVEFTYYGTGIRTLDLETLSFYTPEGGFNNFGYVFQSNITASIGGYTIQDVRRFDNGFFGLGSVSIRNVKTTFPNGTSWSYSAGHNYADYLRIILFRNTAGNLQLAWTFNPYPTNPINANYTGGPSTWTISGGYNQTIAFTAGFQSSGIQNQSITLGLNLWEQGATASNFYTVLGSATGATATVNNPSLIDSIAGLNSDFHNRVQSVLKHIQQSISIQGFFNMIGLGWLYDALAWMVALALMAMQIVILTLPYAGIIILGLHLYYLMKGDFAAIINLWFTMYGIAAGAIGVILTFVQIIIDIIGSIKGAATGAAAAA